MYIMLKSLELSAAKVGLRADKLQDENPDLSRVEAVMQAMQEKKN